MITLPTVRLQCANEWLLPTQERTCDGAKYEHAVGMGVLVAIDLESSVVFSFTVSSLNNDFHFTLRGLRHIKLFVFNLELTRNEEHDVEYR